MSRRTPTVLTELPRMPPIVLKDLPLQTPARPHLQAALTLRLAATAWPTQQSRASMAVPGLHPLPPRCPLPSPPPRPQRSRPSASRPQRRALPRPLDCARGAPTALGRVRRRSPRAAGVRSEGIRRRRRHREPHAGTNQCLRGGWGRRRRRRHHRPPRKASEHTRAGALT
eukprot:361181-Chlamydomonas_euryale.AAC.6